MTKLKYAGLFSVVPLFLIAMTLYTAPQTEAADESDAQTQCREGYVLVFRAIANNYVCVSMETAERWEQQGTAEIVGNIPEEKTMEEPMDEMSMEKEMVEETTEEPMMEKITQAYTFTQDFIPQEKLEIDLSTTAIFITDPQNDFISEGGAAWGLVGEQVIADKVVEHQVMLREAANQVGIPVFYSPHIYSENEYQSWKHLNFVDRVMFERKMFNKGQWGAEFQWYQTAERGCFPV